MGKDSNILPVHKFGKIEAIRYGDADGSFDEGCVARVAQFVLGQEVNNQITVLNERLMNVVTPIDEFWDPKSNVADILVTDSRTGIRTSLSLGYWLARYPSGHLRPIPHNEIVAAYFPPPPAVPFETELEELLVKHGKEHSSGTPASVLQKYLSGCLDTFNFAVRGRARFRGESVYTTAKTDGD